MLKMSPSARPRVATSSISVSLSAATFSRTTSSTGAPVSSTTTWAPATPARSSMMSWRKPRRRVTVPTRPTFASGFSTASSVTRSVSATGRPLTSCFISAYSSCVTLPRRHSRSHVAAADCAAFAAAPHAQLISSSPTIVQFFTSFPLCFVHGTATDNGTRDFDVFDLLGIDGVRILREHDEVRQLAWRDRAFEVLFLRRIRTVQRVHADGTLDADLLIRAPDLAVPAFARDHSLNAHQRRKRTGAEIRPRCRVHAGVEQRTKGHRPCHELLAVEHELVGVVVGVGREQRRDGIKRFDALHEAVIDERAVRDLRTRVRAREQFLDAFERRQVHVDRHIAVGVAVHLDSGAMHPLEPGVQVLRGFGDVALVP